MGIILKVKYMFEIDIFRNHSQTMSLLRGDFCPNDTDVHPAG